jgi:hypothetical protein
MKILTKLQFQLGEPFEYLHINGIFLEEQEIDIQLDHINELKRQIKLFQDLGDSE